MSTTTGGASVSLRIAALAATVVLLTLLALPLLSVLVRVPWSSVASRLADPIVLSALKLSLVTSTGATAVVVVLGTPVAYLLATRSFPGKPLVEVLVDLPMVLPPTVAGFALLMAFGRAGLAGGVLQAFGITIPFTTGAVILAQVFMAIPFFVGSARAGFASVDARYLDAAATLRASEPRTFFDVVLPLSARAIGAGVAMSAARSLGEFGATITFAGNLPGTTQTMPLAVYVALQSDLDAAIVLSVLLLAMSFALLLALRAAPRALFGGQGDAARPRG
jgi:molybdate transport system permease protein